MQPKPSDVLGVDGEIESGGQDQVGGQGQEYPRGFGHVGVNCPGIGGGKMGVKENSKVEVDLREGKVEVDLKEEKIKGDFLTKEKVKVAIQDLRMKEEVDSREDFKDIKGNEEVKVHSPGTRIMG
eukprot:175044-Karenia_brevis.AAC.1